MAKTRISISLEQQQAERIRQHAERAGLDVSAYLMHAATRQMAETETIEAQFAGVDALIAATEAEAGRVLTEAEPPVGELTEQERQDVEAALDLVYGPARTGARPGHAA
ncbi:plasmid mobilization protein [Streptomyces subrutilus]|uniref:Ribbon-helix-helix protein, CopG family n=1 Tax=Streptomyces subrutilus TaxID=36818 RepID=A0A5P2UI36_9ACTN|nr:hypothetical protein [Streptomyces subrutilus]QEU78708.1 hypothetical protein CP968_10730 [Streptomyces subrutilus]WSJ32133.1 hypothetical protein OG479_24230 [Streptomyces subrutilus]GGZ58385.1 hypothetical protein GCM10010371_17380 [Streptomyces subrutilus]